VAWGRGCGFNVVRQVSTAKTVSSYHGVYNFVFVNMILNFLEIKDPWSLESILKFPREMLPLLDVSTFT
jgi:hypothetical protein